MPTPQPDSGFKLSVRNISFGCPPACTEWPVNSASVSPAAPYFARKP